MERIGGGLNSSSSCHRLKSFSVCLQCVLKAAGRIENYLIAPWDGCGREIGARIIAPTLRQLPKPRVRHRNEFLAPQKRFDSVHTRWGYFKLDTIYRY